MRHVAGQCVLPSSSKGSEKGKGDGKFGPLGRKPPPVAGQVPPTTRKPQVVPPRGPPGAGVGSPPAPETPPSPPSEELVKALQLLQSVLSPEDFSKFEKKLVPPKKQERVELREREPLEAVERQANYEKQEQKHLELIAKREHNLAQQRATLELVRTQLAEVRDTVGALLPWVMEASSLPLAVRKNSYRWMLLARITRRLILIRIWRRRLGLSSPRETRKECS